MMNVKKKATSTTVKFSDLSIGDAFRMKDKDTIELKTGFETSKANALVFETCATEIVSADADVVRVDVYVEWQDHKD